MSKVDIAKIKADQLYRYTRVEGGGSEIVPESRLLEKVLAAWPNALVEGDSEIMTFQLPRPLHPHTLTGRGRIVATARRILK